MVSPGIKLHSMPGETIVCTDLPSFQKELRKLHTRTSEQLIMLVGWGLMMTCLDMSIISVIMHDIVVDLDTDMTTVQYISIAYSIFLGAFSIPAGKISDSLGSTRIHRVGIVSFTVASALCGMSTSITMLIICRALQGFSGAILMSCSMSLTAGLSKPKDMGVIMTYNSVIASVATAIGPVAGGFLAEFIPNGWRWCFYVNIIFGIIALIGSLKLPITPQFRPGHSMDKLGSVLLLVGLSFVIFGVSALQDATLVATVICIIGGLLLWWMVPVERDHPDPIFPSEILRNKKVIMSLLAGTLNFATMTPVQCLLPQGLQWIPNFRLDGDTTGGGMDPLMVGILQLSLPLFMLISSPISKRVVQKVCARQMRLFSLAISAVGYTAFGLLILTENAVLIFLGVSIFSVGLGGFIIGNNAYMMSVTPLHVKGCMGGAIQTFRETGYAAGISVHMLLYTLIATKMWGGPIPSDSDPVPEAFIPVFENAFSQTVLIFGACTLGGAAILTYLSGYGDHEQNYIGYPASLRQNEAEPLIEEGNEDELEVPEEEAVIDQSELKPMPVEDAL
eukprot:gnl/Dysnectes_brevis/276_a307_6492.p1 GENE.gnl/Dysnectes_brevis/276_a307_6492~~gnl/Dysnectes_brevis/276_a307_6492.p1  ORF type:complete len:572 (+),score=216.62 gnl/Dysnectes_brevis/276_a307_6492:32-1717(+)